jgi:biopolymer transport protein ExbB
MDTFITLMNKGGYVMIPIFVCSLLALTVVIERLFALRRNRIIPPALISLIRQFSKNNKTPITEYCDSHTNPFTSIVKKLISNSNLPHTEAVEIIKVIGRQETKGLDSGLFLLELIAAITPLMGLLGTVLGMIDVFDTIAKLGVGQAEALSAGISKALITTVAGLSVAIPTLAAYSLLSRKVERLIAEIDRYITNLYGKLYGIHIE